MDLTYGEHYEAFRGELREFLSGWPLRGAEAQLPAAEQERIFRKRGIEAGYVYPSIPADYRGAGRGSEPLLPPINPGGDPRGGATGHRPHPWPHPPVPAPAELRS